MHTPGRRVAAAVAVALVMTSCGGDDAAGDGTGDADEADGAMLGVVAPGVNVADEPADPMAATFRAGADGETLGTGDVVRTDVTGFAEVAWFDGALARVDADTTYALVDLDVTPGAATVITDLQVGRVWNRLRDGTGAAYEVRTAVGTAAVRGTAFSVACPTPISCTFAVLEGTVEVATSDGATIVLGAGEEVTLTDDGSEPQVAPTDPDDAWVVRNAELDVDAGFAPLDVGEDDGGRDGNGAGDDRDALLAALVQASEAEVGRVGTPLQARFIEENFACQAEIYVDFARDDVDAATVEDLVAQGDSLSSIISSILAITGGSPEHLAFLDRELACYDDVREGERWDIAFDQGGATDTSTAAAAWLTYAECLLAVAEPTQDELLATHYFRYYEAGGTDGPLASPGSYLDESTALADRVRGAAGDEGSPCSNPGQA